MVDEEDELQHQLDLLDEDDVKQGPIPTISLDVNNSSRSNSIALETRKHSVTAVEMTPVLGFKKTNKKKKFELPWGFLIVGWFLVIASILVAAWMVIEVAGQFGKEKATEWLTSISISLIQDILLTQPIKVILQSLIKGASSVFLITIHMLEVSRSKQKISLKTWLVTPH